MAVDPKVLLERTRATRKKISTLQEEKKTTPTPTTPTGQTHTVKSGETLSRIGARYGVDWHKITGYRSGDPNLIYPGEVLTIPGAATPTTPTTPITPITPVTPIVDKDEQARIDAADEANEVAQTIFDTLPGDEVDMRDSVKILEGISEKLAETEEKIPAPTSLVDLFQEQKKTLGIEPLETELAGLDADIDRIQTELLVQAEEAGEKLVSTREIGRAKGVLQKRAEREIALLNVERSAVARQLGNKYSSLEMVMNFTQQDFTNASNYYTQQYNRTISLFNLALGLEEREYTRAEKAETDARANWDVVTNAMKENGVSYSDLTEDQKLKLSQLEVQAGLLTGFSEKILASVSPDKTVVSKITSTDKSQISILYDDGTVEVFNTGLAPEAEEAEYLSVEESKKLGVPYGTTKAQARAQGITIEEEITEKDAKDDMKKQLMIVRGTDGYISPESYKKAKEAWFQAGYSKDKFDEYFEMFANPSRIEDYEIAEY